MPDDLKIPAVAEVENAVKLIDHEMRVAKISAIKHRLKVLTVGHPERRDALQKWEDACEESLALGYDIERCAANAEGCGTSKREKAKKAEYLAMVERASARKPLVDKQVAELQALIESWAKEREEGT